MRFVDLLILCGFDPSDFIFQRSEIFRICEVEVLNSLTKALPISPVILVGILELLCEGTYLRLELLPRDFLIVDLNVRLVKAINTLLHTFGDALYRPGMILISLCDFRFGGLLALHFVLHIFHAG